MHQPAGIVLACLSTGQVCISGHRDIGTLKHGCHVPVFRVHNVAVDVLTVWVSDVGFFVDFDGSLVEAFPGADQLGAEGHGFDDAPVWSMCHYTTMVVRWGTRSSNEVLICWYCPVPKVGVGSTPIDWQSVDLDAPFDAFLFIRNQYLANVSLNKKPYSARDASTHIQGIQY